MNAKAEFRSLEKADVRKKRKLKDMPRIHSKEKQKIVQSKLGDSAENFFKI